LRADTGAEAELGSKADGRREQIKGCTHGHLHSIHTQEPKQHLLWSKRIRQLIFFGALHFGKRGQGSL
jgi:hypothetical protein